MGAMAVTGIFAFTDLSAVLAAILSAEASA
jgi:hypothetical protein